MRTFLWFLLLAWILGFTCVEAFADPRVDVKIKYYEVEGDTVEDLKNELKVKTPIRNNGTPFDANTTWYVKWNTQWAMKGMSCGIISVTTRVSIIFTLPKWANYKEHSGKEREKWDRFFQRLVDHENGHKDIAVGSAKELEKSILDMESRKNCDDLKRDANRLGETIIEKYQGVTEQYDLETDHGRKQNASARWNEMSTVPPAK
jgi:predicted secreted Zn-dependent protease